MLTFAAFASVDAGKKAPAKKAAPPKKAAPAKKAAPKKKAAAAPKPTTNLPKKPTAPPPAGYSYDPWGRLVEEAK